jgi:hypothetical protein
MGGSAPKSTVKRPHEAAMDFDSPAALRARVLALEETVLLLASVMAHYPQTRHDLEIRFAELAAHAEARGASPAGKMLYETLAEQIAQLQSLTGLTRH